MTLPMILAPLFVLVLMTFVIGIVLPSMRTPPLMRGEIRPEEVSLREPKHAESSSTGSSSTVAVSRRIRRI